MRAYRHLPSFSSLLCMAAAFLLPAFPSTAQTAEPPAVMIVFDASGSMWGNIEGSKLQKFVLARDALGKALQHVSPNAQVGLVSTGQRRRGDCSDVEALAPLAPMARDKIMGPLDKLNPKGRGPIVLAMREAAKALAGAPNASVVLLHDDLDNCQQDICAAAEEIRKSSPRLKVHTVSLGLAAEDAARMACVAQSTGGRRFEAKDAAAAATMIEEAVKLASVDTGSRGPAAPAAAERSQAPPPPPRPTVAVRRPSAQQQPLEGKPGLRLTASLGPKGELVTVPITWRVQRSGAAAGDAPLLETTAPEASVDVSPGSYVVEARVGLVSAKQSFDVPPERPIRANVVLNAGAAWLVARTHKGGPLLEGTVFSVSEIPGGDPRSKDPARLVFMTRDTEPLVHLPAGAYRIGVQHGLVTQERVVVIESGVSGELEVLMNAGRLQLKAVAREGGDRIDDVVFIIGEDDPDSPQGRKEVTRSAAPEPDFLLTAGTYHVTARQGSNEVRERIAVGAGDAVARAIPMGLARISLALKIDGSPPSAAEPVAFRVLRTDGETREIGRYGASTQRLDLPAGRYRIEAQIGAQNVRSARDIELAAGRPVQIAFDLQTARLILRPSDAAGGLANADIVWEISDSNGRSVARSTAPETRAVLVPGRYTVRGEVRGRRFERVVDLKAGERRTVEAE